MSLNNQQQIDNVKEYYEILRTRQMQIIQIIKETTFLLARMESPARLAGGGAQQFSDKNVDNGLRLAFNMINTLANLLDEQMKALNVWERILIEEKQTVRPPSQPECGFQDYYEINPN